MNEIGNACTLLFFGGVAIGVFSGRGHPVTAAAYVNDGGVVAW